MTPLADSFGRSLRLATWLARVHEAARAVPARRRQVLRQQRLRRSLEARARLDRQRADLRAGRELLRDLRRVIR